MLDRVDGNCFAFDEIKQATRGGDEDVRGALKPGDLKIDLFSTGDDFHEDFGVGVFRKFKEGLANLFGEFARGGEDDGLDDFFRRVDFGEEREAEGGRFSRAGLGLAHEIEPALHEVGDGLGLDRRGVMDTQFVEAFDQVVGDSKGFEVAHGIGLAPTFGKVKESERCRWSGDGIRAGGSALAFEAKVADDDLLVDVFVENEFGHVEKVSENEKPPSC